MSGVLGSIPGECGSDGERSIGTIYCEKFPPGRSIIICTQHIMAKYSTDWVQIFIFLIICGYPFFRRNTKRPRPIRNSRHPIIEFLHGGVVLGVVIGFLLGLILLDIYQLSQDTANVGPEFGLVHTIKLVSTLVGKKIIPTKEHSGTNKVFVDTMTFATGPWVMFAIFLWSVSHYPGLFWKDIWWVNTLMFFLPYSILLLIVGYGLMKPT